MQPKCTQSLSVMTLTDNTANSQTVLTSKTTSELRVPEKKGSTQSAQTSTTKRPIIKRTSYFSNLQRDKNPFPYENIDYIPVNNQELSPKDIKAAGIMKLELLEGDIIRNKEPIMITPNDIIYFYANNNIINEDRNDEHKESRKAILNYTNPLIGNDYFFVVFYIQELNKYKIKFNPLIINDIQNEVFVKIPLWFSIPIQTNVLVTIGKSQIKLIPMKNDNLEAHILHINRKMSFSPQLNQSITFGRDPNCTIAFEKDNTISKQNTIIYYDVIRSSWMIKDGTENKPSSNGSWILGHASFQIYSEMVIVIGNNKLKFVKYEKNYK